MKSMSRILAMLLTLVMVFALVGCAAEQPSTTPADTTTDTPATETPADEPVEEPAEEPVEEPADEPTEEPVEEPAEEPTEEPGTTVSDSTGEVKADNIIISDPSIPAVSLPLVTEPATLKFWWPSVNGLLEYDLVESTDYLYFREMEERTGVHVELEIPNEPQTQFGIMMASQDYPDVIENFGSYYNQGYDHAIDEELIVDLFDYEALMPHMMDKVQNNINVKRAIVTDNGHLPGIPSMATVRGPRNHAADNWAGYMVRQDWLDEFGMEVPKTYDQMGQYLEQVKNNHTEAIPFMLSCMSGQYMVAMGNMFWSGYNVTADWMQIDGQVVYAPMQQGYRDYVKMLNDWFNAGYLDPDLMSATAFFTTAPDAISDQYGAFPIIYTHLPDILGMAQQSIPEYNLTAVRPLKLTEDAVDHVSIPITVASINAVVSYESENVELALQWWDYFFSPEGIVLGNYGVEGETFEYNEEGRPMWKTEAFTSDDPQWSNSSLQTLNILYNAPGYIEKDREHAVLDETALLLLDVWNEKPGNDWTYPAAATMTMEENEAYAEVMGDISTYVSEVTAKLLLGEMNFDEYEGFIASIEQMGINEAIEAKQAALDRYNAR